MDNYTATEIAYKNGYEQGKKDAVKHGEWKRSGVLLECQCCGEIYSQLGGNEGKSWNYCPDCGAKMDGGKT